MNTRTPPTITVVTYVSNTKMTCSICGKSITFFDVVYRCYISGVTAHLTCALNNGYSTYRGFLEVLLKKLEYYKLAIDAVLNYLNNDLRNAKGKIVSLSVRKIIKKLHCKECSSSICAAYVSQVIRTLAKVVEVNNVEVCKRRSSGTARRTVFFIEKDKVEDMKNVLNEFKNRLNTYINFIRNYLSNESLSRSV